MIDGTQNHGVKLLIVVRLDRDSKPSECKSCGASVWWGRTAKGKAMIVDEKPVNHDEANVLLLRGEETAKEAEERGELWITHFATCQQAKDWKKK